MTQPAPRCSVFGALPWPAKVNALALAAGVLGFSVLLWPQWLHDDNLTHGIFLPFLAGILVLESRRAPAPRFLGAGAGTVGACAVLLLASLACVAVAIMYAAALGWTHSMAEFMLSLALVFGLGGGWLAFADSRVRFIPLNWPAAVAAILWLFSSPPPPGTYTRLAFFLQTLVTGGVVRVLDAVGIAAYHDGNVIDLARTTVGVSEACSGVRSLISCTVAGLFLSAVIVRSRRHRVFLIVLSPAIGLAMNFIRSLFLTLLANAGVAIEGPWHDFTGGSILVCTTLLVAALAFWLRRREPRPVEASGAPARPAGRSPLQGLVCAALLAVASSACLLAARDEAARFNSGPVPNLKALLPATPAGWTSQLTPSMESYSRILQTHALVERVYYSGPTLASPDFTLYLAYWRAGQASVSLVDAHTPDACWPGTGWEAEPVQNDRPALTIGGRALPPAECRVFAHNGLQTRVWYWHLYGGRPLTIIGPDSAARLLKLAWRFGFARDEDQLFVRVSSNRPWREISEQPALRQFFENLRPSGL